MHIQCTKKLLNKLKKTPEPLVMEENPLFSWHANIITIDRRQIVVLTNDASRYTIVLPGLKAKDFANIDKLIIKAIRQVLESENISKDVINQYILRAGKTAFTKTKDRSMVAKLNNACDETWVLAPYLDMTQNVSPEVSKIISRKLVTNSDKEYTYPNKDLFAGLEGFIGRSIFSGSAIEIEVSLMLKNHEIWRRLVVPLNRTFKELHRIIQIAFNWVDNHLHEYYILDHTKPNVIEFNPNHPASLMEGYPPIVNLVCNEEAFHYPMDIKMRLENGINLSDYVPASKVMVYQYDLGDDWRHKIEVKNIIGDYDNYHPICLDGNGDAPPEDVGGEPGYDEFVEAIADPEHSEHDHLTEWVKYNFSYRPFDLPEINRRLEDA